MKLKTEIELLKTIVDHIIEDDEIYKDDYKKYALKKVENIKKLLN